MENAPKSIEAFDLTDKLTERIPAIDQALEIARMMPECGDRNHLLIAMASTWKIAHCTLFVMPEDHPEAR